MSTYSKVLRQIELWEHDRQVAAAKAAHEVAAAAMVPKRSDHASHHLPPCIWALQVVP